MLGRHDAPHRARAIALLGASLLVASFGSPSYAAGPAPRVAVEEALRQAARVTWTESGVASGHRLQRRVRGADGAWGDWVDVQGTGDTQRQGYVIDQGADGKGLAPADYAFRLQSQVGGGSGPEAWSDWSEPVEFTLPPQCAGGDAPPGNEAQGSLPTVVIGDLDGDGRYTGEDVWKALHRCSELGGCVLEALPVTYDDVSITFYKPGGGPAGDSFPCTAWKTVHCAPMLPFPKGLVIQGHGSATVFRTPVWKTPYRPAAVFEFWHVPGVQLRFRNFTMDGRKREQPDPATGVNDVAGWRHRGIDVTNYFSPDRNEKYPNGCVHNVTAREFMLSGIEVDHAKNWRIEYNHIADIGCWKGLTDCPLLKIPDTNPPPGWGCDGFKGGGYGIMLEAWSDDTRIVHNDVTRVGKYAMGAKGGGDGVSNPIQRLILSDNRITDVGDVGIFVAGLADSVIENNLVDGTHQYGCRNGGGWATWGIETHGVMQRAQVRNNTLRNLAGVGIGSNAVADGLVFADNTVDNTCLERNAKVESVQGAIQIGDGSAGSYTLSNNRVTNNHCSMALAVCWGSQAQVTVQGGYYSTGDNSDPNFGALYVESGNSPRVPRVRLERGVVFDYLGTQRRPGFVASGNGRIVVSDDTVRVNKYRDPFTTARSAMDGSPMQKEGSVVQCGSSPSNPECQ
jgi:hypothetical protein